MILQHSTYWLLLMVLLAIWAGADSKETTCIQNGGTCVAADVNSCVTEADYPGCDDDELCCLASPPFLNRKLDICDNLRPPTRCKKNYKGICKAKCPNNRIQTGLCNSLCKCCGCQIKSKCSKNHGYCVRKGLDKCDGKIKNTWCIGKKCACCIPKCPDSKECLAASGRCDKSCNDNEKLNRNIRCTNDKCVCCIPKRCATSTCCKAAGGYCAFTCSPGSVVHRTLCEGNNCMCCLPPFAVECPCDNFDDCKAAGGHCAFKCNNGETADPSIPCRSKGDVCCVPGVVTIT